MTVAEREVLAVAAELTRASWGFTDPNLFEHLQGWGSRLAQAHRDMHARLLYDEREDHDFDLRIRSLDYAPGEPLALCTWHDCADVAQWSVWLKLPDGSSPTYTRCTAHALETLSVAVASRPQ